MWCGARSLGRHGLPDPRNLLQEMGGGGPPRFAGLPYGFCPHRQRSARRKLRSVGNSGVSAVTSLLCSKAPRNLTNARRWFKLSIGVSLFVCSPRPLRKPSGGEIPGGFWLVRRLWRPGTHSVAMLKKESHHPWCEWRGDQKGWGWGSPLPESLAPWICPAGSRPRPPLDSLSASVAWPVRRLGAPRSHETESPCGAG